MPKLNEYISVGFCSGYGDGDWRVSLSVQDLSRERFNELKLAALFALHVAEDRWMAAQKMDEAVTSGAALQAQEEGRDAE